RLPPSAPWRGACNPAWQVAVPWSLGNLAIRDMAMGSFRPVVGEGRYPVQPDHAPGPWKRPETSQPHQDGRQVRGVLPPGAVGLRAEPGRIAAQLRPGGLQAPYGRVRH